MYCILFGDVMMVVVEGVIVINEVNVVMGVICVIFIVGFFGILLGILFVFNDCLKLIED